MSSREQKRVASRLSLGYLMAIWGAFLRQFPFDTLDLLILATVSNHNLMGDGGALEKGRIGDVNPPRVGISRNQVSRVTHVPLETVRRRVAQLIERKMLAEQDDGLVFSHDNPHGLGDNAEFADFNFEQLRQLVRSLKERGIELD